MKKNSKPSTSELRRQAEEKLSRQKHANQPEQEVDIPRLVHELQVRQIELELQNEELVQARADLETVLRQYTDLYDFAPIGYFTLTREGAICQVNQAGANLLGVKHNELTQHRFGIFVSSDSLPAYNVFFEQLLTGHGKINCELVLEKKGDGVRWGQIEATCFEGSETCRVMLADITERKQMEQALQESENRFRIILQDVSTIAVQGYAIDGTTQYWNLASTKLYGYSAQEAIGYNLLDLIIPPEMRGGSGKPFSTWQRLVNPSLPQS